MNANRRQPRHLLLLTLIIPFFSRSSTMFKAILSFTLPPGFCISILRSTVARRASSFGYAREGTGQSGVLPTSDRYSTVESVTPASHPSSLPLSVSLSRTQHLE